MAARIKPLREHVHDLSLPQRYQLRRHIASGGMAAVWCAEDLVLGRPVAIKLLSERFAHDELAVRRFKREARAAARVSAHPHVVTIYDVGEAEPAADGNGMGEPGPGAAFIVMEHLAGGTVADALRAGEVKHDEALRWLREAASALDHAHARGIVHRDIKPGNFLLDRDRVLHVADFGIARLVSEDTITSSGELFGTAAYLSPEQARGQPGTAASDRYALAVAAFELLVGERPFTAEHFAAQARQHLEDEPPRASQRNPALPPAVDPVLARGMAKAPEQRYATAAALVAALEAALGAEPVTPRLGAGAAAIGSPPVPATPGPGRSRLGATDRAAGAQSAGAEFAATPRAAGSQSAATPRPAGSQFARTARPAAPQSAAAARGGGPARPVAPPRARATQRTAAPRARATSRAAANPRPPAPARRHGRALALAGLAAAALIVGLLAGSSQNGSPRRVVASARTAPRVPTIARAKPRTKSPAAPKAAVTASGSSRSAASTPPPAAAASSTSAASAPATSADALEAQGHQLMVNGQYSQAIPTLRRAVQAADPQNLTYAYALYDLGRSLVLSGNPTAAVPILEQRLQIPNQTGVVRRTLKLALSASGASVPTGQSGSSDGPGVPPGARGKHRDDHPRR